MLYVFNCCLTEAFQKAFVKVKRLWMDIYAMLHFFGHKDRKSLLRYRFSPSSFERKFSLIPSFNRMS